MRVNILSNKIFFAAILIAGVLLAIYFSAIVFAHSEDDIKYPVKELGGCKNEAECRSFCDSSDNIERVKSCIAFAKEHNLLSVAEIEEAERYVIRAGITRGPGGCRSEKACNDYCENPANLSECLDFAERYNLRSSEEIAEGRKLVKALSEGATLPGGCKDKKTCELYCEDPSRMKECVAFAEKAGFISPEEAKEAQKIIPLLERGEKTPGNCGRKAACEAYCLDASHIDECLAFAERAGIISGEELADAKKFAPLIKSGETPGQCKRKAECESYCNDEGHFEECIIFAEKAGMMTKEDAELARKTKGKGPGGCKSRDECEKFCQDPNNQNECINFAKEHGLVEEVAEIEAKIRGEVESKFADCANKQACSEFIACLSSLKTGGEENNDDKLPPDLKTKLNSCIEEIKNEALKEAGGGEHQIKTENSAPPLEQVEQQKQDQYEKEYQRQYQEEYKKQYEEQVKQQVDCKLFEAAPSCSYAGAPGSQNYDYCKICFPNK